MSPTLVIPPHYLTTNEWLMTLSAFITSNHSSHPSQPHFLFISRRNATYFLFCCRRFFSSSSSIHWIVRDDGDDVAGGGGLMLKKRRTTNLWEGVNIRAPVLLLLSCSSQAPYLFFLEWKWSMYVGSKIGLVRISKRHHHHIEVINWRNATFCTEYDFQLIIRHHSDLKK